MKHNFLKSERVKLYEEVWSEPMVNICKRYNISNVALKKRCIKLQIPTPPPGYWTILKSGGQVIDRPSLPKYTGKHVFDDSKMTVDPFWQNIDRQLTKGAEEYKFKKLTEEATDWEMAQKIRDYVAVMEIKVKTMRLPADRKKVILKRIAWAKKKADWLDPTIALQDEYLGKRSYRQLFFDDDPYYKW